jgi:hypothetical protein
MIGLAFKCRMTAPLPEIALMRRSMDRTADR